MEIDTPMTPMSCSRSASGYQECPVIKFPKDRAAFVKKFIETSTDDRLILLSGHVSRKILLKARDEKDAGKIYDLLVDLERRRYIDFQT